MPDKRTKAYRDIVSMMPRPDGLIEETVDGQLFRYKPERRCRVCSAADPQKGLPNGPHVARLVDSLLMYPKDMAYIYRTIEPMMADWPPQYRISYKSIRTHQDRHLGWDALALRRMVERWAGEKGISILDASGRMLLTEEAWLEATAQKGWQQLIMGQIVPTWKDTQQAFERIAQIKSQAEGEYDKVALLAQLNAIIEAVRESVPPELWPKIIARIEGKDQPALPTKSKEADKEADALFNDILNDQEAEDE